MIKLKSVRYSFILLCSTILLNFSGVFAQASVEQGEKIFKQNCTSCHSIGATKVVGPGMKGVMSRVPSEDWLKGWIKNNIAVIKSGDAYANKIFEEYNKTPMPAQSLTDDEIKSILAYIKDFKEEIPLVQIPVGGTEPKDEGFPWLLLVVTLVLISLAVTLNKTRKFLEKAADQKEGIPVPVELEGIPAAKSWIRKNKKGIETYYNFNSP